MFNSEFRIPIRKRARTFGVGPYVRHDHGSELLVGIQLGFCDCRSLIDEPAE